VTNFVLLIVFGVIIWAVYAIYRNVIIEKHVADLVHLIDIGKSEEIDLYRLKHDTRFALFAIDKVRSGTYRRVYLGVIKNIFAANEVDDQSFKEFLPRIRSILKLPDCLLRASGTAHSRVRVS